MSESATPELLGSVSSGQKNGAKALMSLALCWFLALCRALIGGLGSIENHAVTRTSAAFGQFGFAELPRKLSLTVQMSPK
jgi:hypothetical protein